MTLKHPDRPSQPFALRLSQTFCSRFTSDRWRFPHLRAQLRLPVPGSRQYERRSERLEAIGLVCMAMLILCDLLSFRIGRPNRQHRRRVDGLSMFKIRSWTGLSWWRIARAIYDLHRAGYLHCHVDARGRLCSPQPVEQISGTKLYRGLAAVRCFTDRFFEELGTMAAIKSAQAKRIENQKQEAAVVDLGAYRLKVKATSVKTLVTELAAKLATDAETGVPPPPKPPPETQR